MNRSFVIPGGAVGDLRDVQSIEMALPELPMSVGNTYELLERGLTRAGDDLALSFFPRTEDFRRPFVWTHRQWLASITRTANLFRQLGIGRKDVVAFVLPNLPETHWVIWGGEAAGTVFAVNPLLEPAMTLELLKTVAPKLIVTLAPTPGTDLWQKISSIAPQVPGLRAILTISPTRYLRGPTGLVASALAVWQRPSRIGRVPVLNFHAEMKKAPEDRLMFERPSLDDIASYFCTGGTTGMPKIAVRTHRTEVANALQLRMNFGAETGPGDSYFCGLPLFHVNAQIGTGLMVWSAGGHVVLGTPQGYRAPGLIPQFWSIAAHYRLATFSGVPTVYSALLQSPRDGLDLSSLRFGVCGAAPMPLELIQRFQKATGLKILEGYGLTEGGCVSTINPPDGATRAGSIGLRLPWQQIKIVHLDANGEFVREAETNVGGTIAIAGPNLFSGYLNPAHNKGLWIHIPGATPTRWLNTGDLGRVDEDGYYWLTGRSKELIIRGGHNIDPKMIEEPMHEHPAVALAAAVGRPDAHAGEVPSVYLQLRPGASASAKELQEWAESHISERAAWPKRIQVLPALPTTPVGKIFKPALTDLEIGSVVTDEAQALGIELTKCEVVRDPHTGVTVHWSSNQDAAALSHLLGRYTFKSQQV